jgi:kynurenine formamidase
MIGVDMSSPDFPPFQVHKLLLGNGIFIMENMTSLKELIGIKEYEVFAQPLKIDAEASLVRASARYI